MTMQGVKDDKKERRAEEAAAAAAAAAKRQRIADEKSAAVEKKAEEEKAFGVCEHGCRCGVVPCPWEKWKRCPKCGPKKGLCRARECAAARQPLLLGYNPALEAREV